MKSKIFLFSYLLLLPLLLFAQTFDQAFKTTDNYCEKIINSTSGEFYVLGNSLCKYDKNGNQLWKKNVTTPYPSYLQLKGIAIDSVENVYLTGQYSKECTFEGINFYSSWGGSFFIKLNKNGDLMWSRNIPFALVYNCILKEESINLTGYLQEGHDVYFDNYLLRHETNGFGGFLVTYNLRGSCIFAVSSLTSRSLNKINSMVKSAGKIYLTGNFIAASYPFLKSYGNDKYVENIFLVKHNEKGEIEWMKSAGGKSQDYVTGVTNDRNGNIYITGYTSDYSFPTYFDDIVVNTPGKNNFLAKFDSLGNAIWVKTFGGDYGENAWAIWADTLDNIYIIGEFTGSQVYFDDIHIHSPNPSGATIYVACYNPWGESQWALVTDASQGSGNGYGITGDDKGNLYITGAFDGTMGFGNTTISGNGGYIAKINWTPPITTGDIEISNSKNFFNVFPNPSSGKLTIIRNTTKSESIRVRSLTGAILYENKSNNNTNFSFDLNTAPGIYYIELETENEKLVRKIVINK